MKFNADIFRETGSIYLIFVFILVAGCAHLEKEASLPAVSKVPIQVELSSVPFYTQDSYQCGPAALAMVLDWAGARIALEELVKEVYTPEKKGSFQFALISATRRYGYLPYPVTSADTLIKELTAGHPVIVLQNLGLSWAPRWHYAVVIGYNLKDEVVILHSGAEPRRQVRWSRFIRTWKRAALWGLVILSANELPASSDEKTYLNAVLGLEQAAQWDKAASAYTTALKRWPESLGSLMGLGNSWYALGNLNKAVDAFREVVAIHPQCSAAFNNLAHVLAEQGHYDEALEMARRAISIGGADRTQYLETLHEIKRLKISNREGIIKED